MLIRISAFDSGADLTEICVSTMTTILFGLEQLMNRWSPSMQRPNDLSQFCIVLKQDSTLIAVIEMSLSSWHVAGIVPGVERQPLKKLAIDESALLKLLHRWREEAEKAGRKIERIAVAFEAGRDGFLASALAQGARHRGPCHPRIERSDIA
jgi:transposase